MSALAVNFAGSLTPFERHSKMPKPLLTDDAAVSFFREIVEPTVAEFLADQTSKRRGCLACLALSSMTEHYFHARPELPEKKVQDFKTFLRKQNSAVGAVADVANATKHVLRNGERDKLGYGDVNTHQLNVFGTMRFGWPLGGHEVLVGPDRGLRLGELIQCTMNFWQQKLNQDRSPG